MRIGCLLVPDLPLQALVRAEPELGKVPLAVAEGEGGRARVIHVSTHARAEGVTPGLPVSDALALSPGLLVRWVEPALVESARAAVLDAAASVSPRVEEVLPGIVVVDVEGLSSLFGSERGAASALVGAAGRVGLAGRAAVASGKTLARIAAARGDGLEVVEPGKERAFLAPLSLAALGASPRLVETLARWGIASAGDLAALPSAGVGTRLGEEGARLHRLVSGRDDEPLVPVAPPETFEEGCELDWELPSLEALLFLLRPVLERLVGRLDCHAWACGHLSLRLLLDPSGEVHVPVELAAPTRDVGTLVSLCRAALERVETGSPVRGLRVAGRPATPRREQLRLFGRPTVAPEKLATAVAKVAAIVGAERVGSPRTVDSHLPENHAVVRFEPPPPPDTDGEPAPGRAPAVVGLRVFRPALEAEVRVGRDGPQAVRARGVNGWIVSLAGPWRLDLAWGEAPARRDAFDAELSDGAVYRLARDLGTGRWSIVGRYD
jgi:protein ImuB